MKTVPHCSITQAECTRQRRILQTSEQLVDFLLHIFTMVLQLIGCADDVAIVLNLLDQCLSGNNEYT